MNRQLKRFLSAGLAAVVLSTAALPASAASVSDFKDVSPNAWYYSAVEYAATNGLFAGTSATTFSPETPMTRGMFVTVLGRKSGVPDTDPASTSFSDVKTTDYFAPYVEWAANNGIVSGMGGGKYAPNKEISRQEMATILYRYSQKTGNEGIQNGTEILRFPDTGAVADWAKEAMTWAVDKEIIKGSGGKLDPTGTATRAQVAQVLFNAKDVLVKTEFVEPPIAIGTEKRKNIIMSCEKNLDFEEDRFVSISDFKTCINHGGEVDFEWKGVHYGVVRYGTDNKICIYEANKQETEKVCETVDDALEYMVGEDRLRDVVTKVTVWARTI